MPAQDPPIGMIRTVCGDRPAADFAAVMVHEHLLYDITHPGAVPDDTQITPQNRWQIDYL